MVVLDKCKKCLVGKYYAKGFCDVCYYADKRGGLTRSEVRQKRNFICGNKAFVSDTNGEKWEVDIEDFNKVNKFLWSSNGIGYASRVNSSRERIYLHRYICPRYEIVDHINRNTYDCRKENLREGVNGAQGLNKEIKKKSITGFRGVHKARGLFQARMQYNKKKYYLGTYKTAEIAGQKIREFIQKMDLEDQYVFN